MKKTNPPHSSFYILANVESGWFVIYFSKLSAASSLSLHTSDSFFASQSPALSRPVLPWPQCMHFLVDGILYIEKSITVVIHYYLTTKGARKSFLVHITSFIHRLYVKKVASGTKVWNQHGLNLQKVLHHAMMSVDTFLMSLWSQLLVSRVPHFLMIWSHYCKNRQ